DNGVGIPPEEHAKIFDDFYRAPSSTPVRGSGLGLSIARKIMEAHQGSIAIDATGPEGTTFALRFPAGSVV
ncbi:MAG: sensor histidine kinase, partial [Myxococcota bacterium]